MAKVRIQIDREGLARALPAFIEQSVHNLNLEWEEGGGTNEQWKPGRIKPENIEKHLTEQEMYELWGYLSQAVELLREVRNRQLETLADQDEAEQAVTEQEQPERAA